MPINQDFKNIISEIKFKDKLTQAQIAESLDVKSTYLSDMINGRVPVSDSILNKIYELYSYVKLSFDTEKTRTVPLKNDLFKSIPFYDINVSAGDIVFLDGGLLKDKEPDDWFDIPKSVDADIAFPTYGHSMSPVITNGDRVAYKFITDWSFFNYGMKYMIVTDEQRMVKYLRKHEKEGFILLESENPEYDPIDMPISSVRNILQVRYIGKIEM